MTKMNRISTADSHPLFHAPNCARAQGLGHGCDCGVVKLGRGELHSLSAQQQWIATSSEKYAVWARSEEGQRALIADWELHR